MINDIEHLYMCLLTIYVCFGKMSLWIILLKQGSHGAYHLGHLGGMAGAWTGMPGMP